MKKVTESLPNHYSSLEDLILYRWDKYVQTKDNNWFLVDYDGREKKIISEELKEVESKLVDEYFSLIDDRGFSIKIQKWAKIDSLRTKYHVVGLLLDRMFKGFADFQMENRLYFVKELNLWGFKFPELNSEKEDHDLILQYRHALEGISTQIGILSNELKDDGKKQAQDLNRQMRLVEIGLGYSYRLNPKLITVKEWISEVKMLEEKSKQN